MTKGGGRPASPSGLLPIVLRAGSTFFRIHQADHGPVAFGPKRGSPPAFRFDAPNGEYALLYGARQLQTAFGEQLLRRPDRIVARDYVEQRQWSVLRTLRDLKLVKLYDNGLSRLGLDANPCLWNFSAAQNLCLSFYQRFPDLDGLAYRPPQQSGEICFALFDRVGIEHLPAVSSGSFSKERRFTETLMRYHRASWDPMIRLPELSALLSSESEGSSS